MRHPVEVQDSGGPYKCHLLTHLWQQENLRRYSELERPHISPYDDPRTYFELHPVSQEVFDHHAFFSTVWPGVPMATMATASAQYAMAEFLVVYRLFCFCFLNLEALKGLPAVLHCRPYNAQKSELD